MDTLNAAVVVNETVSCTLTLWFEVAYMEVLAVIGVTVTSPTS